jgi:nucleoside-diphosphate-sugar epimerase
MTNVLVTGANGFIGSHLCEALLERGSYVLGLVRPTSDVRCLQSLAQRFGKRFRLVLGDLTQPATLGPAIDGADYVYHTAATVMGTSEAAFRASIVDGTRNLLEALVLRAGPPPRRLLFVSSQAAAGPSPTSEPLTENDRPNPVSWYGQAKRDAEDLVRAAGDRIPYTIVRPVAVYGEREADIAGGTFPAVQAGILPRIGLREKTVTAVYVGDLVQGMIAAAESSATQGRTYFLADPKPVSSRVLVDAIAGAMNDLDKRKRFRVPVFVPQPLLGLGAPLSEWAHYFTRARPRLTRDKYREMRHRHWAASPSAAQRDFGWQASTPLREGMRGAIQQWRENRRALGDVQAQPDHERAVLTYLLAIVMGVIYEGLSEATKLYEFHPRWFIVPVVVGFYGLMLGTLAFLTAGWKKRWQFLAAAAVFITAEMTNHYVLHLWDFSAGAMGPMDPWVRALVLAVPMGLVPVIVNSTIGAVYRRRLRIG